MQIKFISLFALLLIIINFISPPIGYAQSYLCSVQVVNTNGDQVQISGSVHENGQPFANKNLYLAISGAQIDQTVTTNNSGGFSTTLSVRLDPGNYPIQIKENGTFFIGGTLCEDNLFIEESTDEQGNTTVEINTTSTSVETYQIRPQECGDSLNRPSNPGDGGLMTPGQTMQSPFTGIQTALGCIPTEPKEFVAWLFQWGLSIGGGVAFIMMGMGGFLLLTSTGVPEKIKAGQELITSALAGLLFIIFAVFLLKLIGFQILQIPGFG